MRDMADESPDDMNEDHPGNPERGRGVLTRNDRDWIVNRPEDLNESTKRQKAQRIRDRLHQSILDFPILLRHLDYADLKQAFEDRTDPEPGAQMHFSNALFDVIAVLYLGRLERNEETAVGRGEGWYFEEMASGGIKRALIESGSSVENVEVSVNIERGPRFEEVEDLSDQTQDMLFQLHQAGEITGDEFSTAMSAVASERAEDGGDGS